MFTQNLTSLLSYNAGKNGVFSPSNGFILINSDESAQSKKKGPFSSEYSDNGYRPYVVMTYTEPVEEEEETPTISLPSISSVALGQSSPLTAVITPTGASVTWGSTNTEVATVSSTGVVTGKKIGTTTIIARITNTSVFAECTLYVHLPDGVYYLNSSVSSKYLNNNNGTPNGYSAPMSTLATSAAWEFIYQSPGQYYIRSCVSPYLYLADTSNGTSSSVGLVAISSLTRNQCLWTIEKSYSFNEFTLTSYYGRKLTSISSSSAASTLILSAQPPHTDWWRFVCEDDMIELTDFSINLNELECFETVDFQVLAGGSGQSFVGTRDFSFEITSGSSYLTLSTNGTIFASATGKNVGTTIITVTYKVSGLSKTFEVDVLVHRLRIGISTDNYFLAGTPTNFPFYCPLGDRGSSLCSDAFWNTLASHPSIPDSSVFQLDLTFRHNNKMVFNSASKQDMLTLSDSVDFMLFVGHGIAADRDPHYGTRAKGNSLHYTFDATGEKHTGAPLPASCFEDRLNFYTSEARFGAGINSNLKWILTYSCNFLHTSDYVSEDDLKEMLQGARIIMGYSTRCCLYSGVTELIATEIGDGTPIIDAFFKAGSDVELTMNDNEPTEQVAYYVYGARDDTIFNVFESTTIDSPTVLKVFNQF